MLMPSGRQHAQTSVRRVDTALALACQMQTSALGAPPIRSAPRLELPVALHARLVPWELSRRRDQAAAVHVLLAPMDQLVAPATRVTTVKMEGVLLVLLESIVAQLVPATAPPVRIVLWASTAS